MTTQPAPATPKPTKPRRTKIFERLFSGTSLSVIIAALALAGFIYTAYEDIKPTLVVGFGVQRETTPSDRSEQLSIAASIANTGRRAARDVHIRVDIVNICQEDYTLRYIPPGYSAVPLAPRCTFEIPDAPLLEEHFNKQMEEIAWIKVDVKYKWDLLWFSIPYSASEIIETDEHHLVNMQPY